MKKILKLSLVLCLSVICNVSFASIIEFAQFDKDKKQSISSINKPISKKAIAINYNIQSNWKVNSASLWIKAKDDARAKDGSTNGMDRKEQAKLSGVNGIKGLVATKEINGQKWYQLLDITSILANGGASTFKALLRSSFGGDFLFKNAKLIVDYSVNIDARTAAPVAAVSIPGAIWLFGSIILGILGTRSQKQIRLA